MARDRNFGLRVLGAAQMIPTVRALLSTSWDSKIRKALNKEKTEAATYAGQPAVTGFEGKYVIFGTMMGEKDVTINGRGHA